MVVIAAHQDKVDLQGVRAEPQPAKFDHLWVCIRTARQALSNTLAETVGMTCRCAMAAQLPWLLLPLIRIRGICKVFILSPSQKMSKNVNVKCQKPAKFDHVSVCRRTTRQALSNTLAETVGMTCRCAM